MRPSTRAADRSAAEEPARKTPVAPAAEVGSNPATGRAPGTGDSLRFGYSCWMDPDEAEWVDRQR